MIKEDLKNELWRLDFEIAINAQYHQRLTFLLGAIDRAVRILVGVAAVLSLLASTLPSMQSWSLWVSIGSLVAAIVLNIIPFDRWEQFFASKYQAYTLLGSELQRLETEVFGQRLTGQFLVESKERFINENVKAETQREFSSIMARRNELESSERWDWGWLNRRCQETERSRRWGPEVKTYQQEMDAIQRLKQFMMQKPSPDNGASPA